MATPEAVTPLRPLPTSVELRRGMTLTPNEMRLLKAATGRPLSELLGGDAEDMDEAPDRIQSLVWIQLRRDGYQVQWEEAGDVLPTFAADTVDPTNAER